MASLIEKPAVYAVGKYILKYKKFDYMFNCEEHGEHYDWLCSVCEVEAELEELKKPKSLRSKQT